MFPTVGESQEKIRRSEKVGEFYIQKSGKTQRVRESQGIYKYQGAKVNIDEEKHFELLYADCIQQFRFFPARFTCRLFVPPLLNLFH